MKMVTDRGGIRTAGDGVKSFGNIDQALLAPTFPAALLDKPAVVPGANLPF
jgi:hypothetical protein